MPESPDHLQQPAGVTLAPSIYPLPCPLLMGAGWALAGDRQVSSICKAPPKKSEEALLDCYYISTLACSQKHPLLYRTAAAECNEAHKASAHAREFALDSQRL